MPPRFSRTAIDLDGIVTATTDELRPLLVRLVCSGLEAGYVPADAFKRGLDALEQVRRELGSGTFDYTEQVTVEDLLVAALKSRGAETGFVLAVRAVQAWRLIVEWERKMADRHRVRGVK